MTTNDIDVLGIGNAIVDVLAQSGDDFVAGRGLVKGSMTLVDWDQSEALYSAMPKGVEKSGGSGANTIAGVAALGGKGAYIGKVHQDSLGETFRHDIQSLGVEYRTTANTAGPSTARCLILVTPDAQRTMSTYLGASGLLSPADVDQTLVSAAQITYLEGYLFDAADAKEAFRVAAAAAHAAGRRVSLSLSDSFCVQRYRADFLELVRSHVDILFANEAEITALFEANSFDAAAAAVRPLCSIAALTRGEKGSVVLSGADAVSVAAAPAQVLDTTGAGDLYASGFLYGLTHGRDLAASGHLGSLCAADCISHIGARPLNSLKPLLDR
ncbi:MAG: adenosine kinase [Chloroflexota bacterium]